MLVMGVVIAVIGAIVAAFVHRVIGLIVALFGILLMLVWLLTEADEGGGFSTFLL